MRHTGSGHAVLIHGVVAQVVEDSGVVRVRSVGSGNSLQRGIGRKIVIDDAGFLPFARKRVDSASPTLRSSSTIYTISFGPIRSPGVRHPSIC